MAADGSRDRLWLSNRGRPGLVKTGPVGLLRSVPPVAASIKVSMSDAMDEEQPRFDCLHHGNRCTDLGSHAEFVTAGSKAGWFGMLTSVAPGSCSLLHARHVEWNEGGRAFPAAVRPGELVDAEGVPGSNPVSGAYQFTRWQRDFRVPVLDYLGCAIRLFFQWNSPKS